MGKHTFIPYRYDDTMPKVEETKAKTVVLWKAYQFTDELAPYMEFLDEQRSKSTKDVVSNAAAETEELIDKHEKCMDQIDKKKKSVLDQTAKGEKVNHRQLWCPSWFNHPTFDFRSWQTPTLPSFWRATSTSSRPCGWSATSARRRGWRRSRVSK